MKKVQFKELLMTIKNSAVEFASLILIISLGLSTYLGIKFAGISMLKTGTDYYNESNFENIELSYRYGFQESDIDKIKEIDTVTDVEGGYFTTGYLQMEEKQRLVSVEAVTDSINRATVIKGRLPEKENEIAIEEVMYEETDIKIGDEITIDCKDDNSESLLLRENFKVVGVVQHPKYICNYEYGKRGNSEKGNGNCLNFLLVSKKAFDKEQLDNCYTNIYICSDYARKAESFSSDYDERCQEVINEIELLGKKLARQRYNEMQEELEEKGVPNTLEYANWNVIGRMANASYVMLKAGAETINRLSISFAFVYILVAAMVCYSSMGRIITEQKIYIGTQKALGYKKQEILRKYIIYAVFSVVCGSYGGILSAIYFVEKLTLKSYVPMFIFDSYKLAYSWKYIILILCGAVIIMVGATLLACTHMINLPTVSLLNTADEKNMKPLSFERFKWWKKLSLYKRAMIRNLITDKKYVVSTIIGVSGCTALMIIGFTLKFSIQNVVTEQFEKIFNYDMVLTTKCNTEDELQKFEDYFGKKGDIEYISILGLMNRIRVNKKEYMSGEIIVTDTDKINEYFQIKDEKGNKLVVPSKGVLVNNHLANYYGVKEGDYIEVFDRNGIVKTVEVAGFFQNYVNHYIIMNPDYYSEVFDQEYHPNTFYVKIKSNVEGVRSDLQKIEKFSAFSDKSMGTDVFENIAKSIDSIIQILIFLSGMMALVVVLNLAAMNIKEKERQLMIMRVNGFTVKETKAYIAKNNRIVTVAGIIFGVVLGVILGYFIVLAIENDTTSFIHTPSLKACILGCSLSTVFAIVVNTIARSKIRKLQLNSINSIE